LQILRSLNVLLAGVLLLATVVLYSPSLRHDFVLFDDNAHIYENPIFAAPILTSLGHIWNAPYFSMYVPLTYSVWRIETEIFGEPKNPALNRRFPAKVYHATNVVLHAVNALLVFLLLQQLGIRPISAFFGAALFAFHPLQTEVASWISCLKDALGIFFSLIALRYYLSFLRAPVLSVRNDHYVYATAAYLLALLSKPAAISIPLWAFILGWGYLRYPFRRNVLALTLWFAIAVGTTVFLRSLQPNQPGDFIPPLLLRPYLAADALGFYVAKFFYPYPLSIDYGRNPSRVLADARNFFPLIPFFLLSALWFLPKNYRRNYLVGTALGVTALLPVLGWIPFRFQQFSTVGDRYAYLALVVPAWALARLLQRFRTLPAYAVASFGLAVLFTLSLHQQANWQNSYTLFNWVLKNNPRSLIAHANLGAAFSRDGNNEAAIYHYERAIALKPEWIDGHFNLGVLWINEKRPERAREQLRTVIDLAPEFPGAAELLARLEPTKS